MAPKLLDTKEAATLLGLSNPRSLENWRLQGKGPLFRKIGGRVRYVESELIAYIESCKRQSTSQVAA